MKALKSNILLNLFFMGIFFLVECGPKKTTGGPKVQKKTKEKKDPNTSADKTQTLGNLDDSDKETLINKLKKQFKKLKESIKTENDFFNWMSQNDKDITKYNLLIKNEGNKFKENIDLRLDNFSNSENGYQKYEKQISDLEDLINIYIQYIQNPGNTSFLDNEEKPLGDPIRDLRNIINNIKNLGLLEEFIKKINNDKEKKFTNYVNEQQKRIIYMSEFIKLKDEDKKLLPDLLKFAQSFLKENNALNTAINKIVAKAAKASTDISNFGTYEDYFRKIYLENPGIFTYIKEKEFGEIIDPLNADALRNLIYTYSEDTSFTNLLIKYISKKTKKLFNKKIVNDANQIGLNELLTKKIDWVIKNPDNSLTNYIPGKEYFECNTSSKFAKTIKNYFSILKTYKTTPPNTIKEGRQQVFNEISPNLFLSAVIIISQIEKMLQYISLSEENKTQIKNYSDKKYDQNTINKNEVSFLNIISNTFKDISFIINQLLSFKPQYLNQKINFEGTDTVINYTDEKIKKRQRVSKKTSTTLGFGGEEVDYYFKNKDKMQLNLTEYAGMTYKEAWEKLFNKIKKIERSKELNLLKGVSAITSQENKYLFYHKIYPEQLKELEDPTTIGNKESLYYYRKSSSNYKIYNVFESIYRILYKDQKINNILKVINEISAK